MLQKNEWSCSKKRCEKRNGDNAGHCDVDSFAFDVIVDATIFVVDGRVSDQQQC